ncbi:mannitol dehydrogenase family protein [Aeromonas cavernicola]|uniref:D-mannonate oxidoreductase n=1 Tax=Aeromonas cavernicola TaxID=1006623 RepID=A0A2H9U5F1_9GAMM|nr:mannitol dehydrogenase family protein [Aeromonas cavernicola]PJG59262.1 D-mannonate oxidoreductase [Aeromonas cavernicola]
MSCSLLTAHATLPTYDRQRLVPRIVHLGVGAFHRAHQAVYADELASEHGSDWGYVEINVRSGGELIAHLQAQDHLFSVSEMSQHGWQSRVVGVVRRALYVGQEGISAVLAALSDADVAIISMTVTEKGYCYVPATGELDMAHPAICHDVAHPTAPTSMPGIVVAALAQRRAAGLSGVSIMSCDNMPENGKVTKQVVLALARQWEPELAEWIDQHCRFPSTMVDRIVPAVSAETAQQIAAQLGVPDAAGVVCEPFRQWVVEDDFVAGRPEWQRVGVELVSDVVPYEEMKLRMLNGSHSFLAYLGYLAGYEHINDCMADPHFAHAARQLMLNEQAPTLRVSGVDIPGYADSLLMRYTNPALKHRTWQIAMDGSVKLPQRLLEPIRHNLKAVRDIRFQSLAVAAWMRYVSGLDEQGGVIDVRDPMLTQLQTAVQNSADGEARVHALLSIEAIFGQDLPLNRRFRDAVLSAYLSLQQQGAAKTIKAYCQCG